MLTGKLIHPQILSALGQAGHGAAILIPDGNYPFATGANPLAERVYLNLAPGDGHRYRCAESRLERGAD